MKNYKMNIIFEILTRLIVYLRNLFNLSFCLSQIANVLHKYLTISSLLEIQSFIWPDKAFLTKISELSILLKLALIKSKMTIFGDKSNAKLKMAFRVELIKLINIVQIYTKPGYSNII